jgi:hypothetical protein
MNFHPTDGPSRRSRRTVVLTLAAAALLAAAAFPSFASAQATRTWVSGVGDDANPCSRTAPCKTFAGAISKTASGGIINTLDPGGFGAVTITKPITISASGGGIAGSLASGGINAININTAGANDRVVLRGLDIEGNGTTLGLNGVRIIKAGSVRIQDCEIFSLSQGGVSFEPTTANSKLVISNTNIHNIRGGFGNGVNVTPTATGSAKYTIKHSQITDSINGVQSSALAGPVRGYLVDNLIGSNDQNGMTVFGGNGIIRVSDNDFLDNGLIAMSAQSSGQIISFKNNRVAGNGTDGTSTSTVDPLRRR